LEDLRKSGLADKTILDSGIRTVSLDAMKATLGFLPRAAVSAYDIPYPDLDFSRFKVFYDPAGKKWSAKYLQPKGSGNHLYIPTLTAPYLGDASAPMYLVEGEKKSLRGAQEGLICVGLAGLWNWSAGDKQLISDFDRIALQGRQVFIVPDSDWLEPGRHGYAKNLKNAVFELAARLKQRGAKVYVISLPNEEEGK